MMQNDVEVNGFNFILQFDPSLIVPLGIQPLERAAAVTGAEAYRFADDRISFVLYDQAGNLIAADSGRIFEVQFLVTDSLAADSSTEVTFLQGTAADGNLSVIPFSYINGAIAINPPTALPPTPLLISPPNSAANRPTTITFSWFLPGTSPGFALGNNFPQESRRTISVSTVDYRESLGRPAISSRENRLDNRFTSPQSVKLPFSAAAQVDKVVEGADQGSEMVRQRSTSRAGGYAEEAESTEVIQPRRNSVSGLPEGTREEDRMENEAIASFAQNEVRIEIPGGFAHQPPEDSLPGLESSLRYRLQLAFDSLFANLVFDDSTLISNTMEIGPLFNGTTYYWRVRAKNSFGPSPSWSDIWRFSTLAAPAVAATVVCPVSSSQSCPVAVRNRIDMSAAHSPDNLLGSLTGTLAWDPALLHYTANSGLLSGFSGNVAVDTLAGLISFNGDHPTGAGGIFDILNADFEATGPIGAAPLLDLDFSAMVSAGTLANLLPILTITDCAITISEPACGETLTAIIQPIPPMG